MVNYDKKLEHLKTKIDSQHLKTFFYRGYDIICVSGQNKGVTYYFFKDKQLIKTRKFVWKNDILLYPISYIDQNLINP